MPITPNGHGLIEDRSLREAIAAEATARVAGQSSNQPSSGFSSAFQDEQQALPVAQPEPQRRALMDAFVRTCQRWGLPTSDQIVLLGYRGNQFMGSEIISGRFLDAPQDAKDRASYILSISLGLGAIFNEALDAERAWLNAPHPDLGGRTPIQLMLLGRMTNVLTVAALVEKERNLR